MDSALIPITADDLVDLTTLGKDSGLFTVDLVYARADHPENIFKTGIYRRDADMWAHKDFAPIIIEAAKICRAQSDYLFELKDCLRTVEAQEKMRQTAIVRANPQWLEEPGRLLSPPGKGGHPRGMAVDIVLRDASGELVDMGTPFDYLTADRSHNPSARSYKNLSDEILGRRLFLENCMREAADKIGRFILPLPQEWWDFRFLPDDSNKFAPVHDRDLPPHMRMTDV
jgi:D-alanyl-D-alanine dipeptidase